MFYYRQETPAAISSGRMQIAGDNSFKERKNPAALVALMAKRRNPQRPQRTAAGNESSSTESDPRVLAHVELLNHTGYCYARYE